MHNRFEIDMLLLQTEAALHASRAMLAQSKRDRAYEHQPIKDTQRAIEESRRQLTT